MWIRREVSLSCEALIRNTGERANDREGGDRDKDALRPGRYTDSSFVLPSSTGALEFQRSTAA